jgi:hypothetical protein
MMLCRSVLATWSAHCIDHDSCIGEYLQKACDGIVWSIIAYESLERL